MTGEELLEKRLISLSKDLDLLLRRQLRLEQQYRRGRYAWLALLLSCIIGPTLAIAVAVNVNARSDRLWCGLIVTLDEAWTAKPPTTESGKNLAVSVANIRRQFGCSPE